MKNEKNVDKLGGKVKNTPVFQQKIKNYSQGTKLRVDNVERINHIWKIRKFNGFGN